MEGEISGTGPGKKSNSIVSFLSTRNGITSVLLAVVVIAVGVGVVLTLSGQKTFVAGSEQPLADQREMSKLVDKVGGHILLPQGEQATIATVSDVTKLQDQEFFKNAQNGDKVLIYAQAKKAILYRPSEDKVIEVGPVFDESAQEDVAGASTGVIQPAQQPVVSPSPTQIPQQEGTNAITPTVTNSATQ